MGLLACKECGNQVSSVAAFCPKCGAPVPKNAGGNPAEPTPTGDVSAASIPPTPIGPDSTPAAKKSGGFGKGCLAAIGCATCVGVSGLVAAGGFLFYGMRSPHARPVVARYETPREVTRATAAPERTPERYVAPIATVAEIATPRPTPEYVEPTPAPRPTEVARVAPRPTATPRVIVAATPRPTPTPRAAAPTPAPRPTQVARAAATATPLPWEEGGDTRAAAVAPTPIPKPTAPPAPVDANARVIHAIRGERTVSVNKNIAITGSDGKTVVGILVNVSGGFVDIRVNGQLLRISEHDVTDAASY